MDMSSRRTAELMDESSDQGLVREEPRRTFFSKVGARARVRLALQLAPAVFLLLIFFFIPLLRSVWGSFGGAEFDFSQYREAFSDELYYAVFRRTLETASIVTALCIVLGYPLTYFMTTLSRRGTAVLSIFILVPLFTAFLIRTYGWIILLGRAGVLNKLLLSLGIIDSPLRILGTSLGVYVGMVHVLMPIAVFVMYASMVQIDRTLLTASQVLGATPVRAFTRVYFPMSLPSVVSAGVLVFIIALGFYITPVLLGGPPDTMISQLIVTQITSLLNLKFGYALSAILLVVTLILIAASNIAVPIEQMWALQDSATKRNSFAFGRTGATRPLRWAMARLEHAVHLILGKPSWLFPVLLKIYVIGAILFLIAPLVIVYVLSFSSSPFLVFPPPGFSLQWYQKFFTSTDWRNAVLMSLQLGAVVASVSTAIGAAGAFGLVRGAFPGKRVVFLLILAPLLVPVIVVSLSLYVSMADFGLLGTFPGLVIGHMVLAVPYTIIIVVAAVRGLDRNLEYAASTLGASPFVVLRKVVLPLLAPALGTAWVMAFLQSFDELLVTLFLLGRQSPTLPIKMWSDIRIQIDPVISAASSSIVTVVAVVIIASQLRSLLPTRRASADAYSEQNS